MSISSNEPSPTTSADDMNQETAATPSEDGVSDPTSNKGALDSGDSVKKTGDIII